MIRVLLLCSLLVSLAPAARADELEEIPVDGGKARYIVDRARGLCYFQIGYGLTTVDCARVLSPRPSAPLPQPMPSPAPSPQPAPSPAPVGNARLVVQARPWANVSVDGSARGTTPKSLELTPGMHRIVLTYNDRIRMITVSLDAGETLTVSTDMTDTAGSIDTSRTPTP